MEQRSLSVESWFCDFEVILMKAPFRQKQVPFQTQIPRFFSVGVCSDYTKHSIDTTVAGVAGVPGCKRDAYDASGVELFAELVIISSQITVISHGLFRPDFPPARDAGKVS